MPTSASEAKAIVSIMGEFMTQDECQLITERLNSEVGTISENNSLKTSLNMLSELYRPEPEPPKIVDKSMFGFIIASHFSVVTCNLIAAVVIAFYQPWYVALPIITLIVNLMFSPISCPLTRLENHYRRRMGKTPIAHFVGHYIFGKGKEGWRRKRAAKS
jgi:membrane protein insertase Oxa1/YidC/SpoIIIJ